MNYLDEILKVISEIPVEVQTDVNTRIGDWLATGGKETDGYMKQQLTYVRNIINAQNGEF